MDVSLGEVQMGRDDENYDWAIEMLHLLPMAHGVSEEYNHWQLIST